MTIIGITGPTGSGKTTALNVLVELGAVLLDCDAVYHELTTSCIPMRRSCGSGSGRRFSAKTGS